MITVASGQASLQAFRVGIGAAGGLVMIDGLIGAAGLRNPRRAIRVSQNAQAGNSPAHRSTPRYSRLPSA